MYYPGVPCPGCTTRVHYPAYTSPGTPCRHHPAVTTLLSLGFFGLPLGFLWASSGLPLGSLAENPSQSTVFCPIPSKWSFCPIPSKWSFLPDSCKVVIPARFLQEWSFQNTTVLGLKSVKGGPKSDNSAKVLKVPFCAKEQE